MCGRIDPSLHPSHLPRIAGYDILAWKVYRVKNKRNIAQLYSPFRGTRWKRGQRMKSDLVRSRDRVYEGLHAFVTEEAAITEANSFGGTGYVVRPVIIPCSAQFYLGTRRHIIADEMTVYESLEAIGRPVWQPNLSRHKLTP